MQATLNIRLDGVLKERGEKVLKSHGISVSAAVRALWEQLATTKELPDFLATRTQEEQMKTKRVTALKALAGVAEGSCSHLTDEQMQAIYEARYE